MAASDSEAHPRQIGQYEILGALGKGAMGQVYKAVQPSLNRIVAVKVLPSQFLEDEKRVERFNREAQAVALLNHPNIVQIIDKDQDEETLYFVMEYVAGSSLDQVLRQRRLSLQEALSVFRGVCCGLEAAHRQNVIHRDLNPRNILVSEDLAVVKLADFGISKVESISREMGTLSTAESSIGSLHYMSPEQSVSAGSVDHRTDIYSAGVVLYEMLTGRVPVGRFSLPSQLNSEVPSELDPVVLRCLATDPKDRYSTVSQLIKAIGRLEDQLRLGLVNELKGISRSTSRIFRSSTQTLARNRKLLIGTAIGAAVIAVVALGATLLSKRSATAPAGLFAAAAEQDALELEVAAPLEPEAVDAIEIPDRIEVPEEPPPAAPVRAPQPRPEARRPAPTPTPAAPAPAPPSTAPVEPALPSGDAEYKVALDKLKAGLFEPAIADFEEFLRNFPDSDYGPAAYLHIAEAQVGAGRLDQALAGFVEVQSRFPEARETAQATYRYADILLQTDRPGRREQAREVFERVAVQFPNTNWAPLALMNKAALELVDKVEANDPVVGGRVPTALLTYRMVAELYGSTPYAEKALGRLAELYLDEKRFDLAASTYQQLASTFPQGNADAWWEAGQLYDRKLADDARALAAYRNVPAGSRHYDSAQKRIQKLSR